MKNVLFPPFLPCFASSITRPQACFSMLVCFHFIEMNHGWGMVEPFPGRGYSHIFVGGVCKTRIRITDTVYGYGLRIRITDTEYGIQNTDSEYRIMDYGYGITEIRIYSALNPWHGLFPEAVIHQSTDPARPTGQSESSKLNQKFPAWELWLTCNWNRAAFRRLMTGFQCLFELINTAWGLVPKSIHPEICNRVFYTHPPLTKVKPGRAGLVLGWVTAWEYPVSRALLFLWRTISAKNQSCVSTFIVCKQHPSSIQQHRSSCTSAFKSSNL